MRIAILSDIHSNLQALTRAFSIIDQEMIDEIYCLGDIVGYGGNPNECVQIIRQRAIKCVLGNHDLAAVKPTESSYFTKPGRIAAEWTNIVLTAENREFLNSLPYLGQTNICTIVHASPHRPEAWEYVMSLDSASSQFNHFEKEVCFIGHTHVPFICGEDLKTFDFQKGKRFLINVGSVGQPRDHNPQLSFGIFDSEAWTYENVRLSYDVASAADAIRKNGLPRFLADRLFKGV